VLDLGQWLRGLGLGQYEATFRDNAVDGSVVLELTADDLKEMGVAAVGHRRKLLAAIDALRGTRNEPAAGSTASPAQPAPSSAAQEPVGAERRQLTVLFCDLVGSTALSTRLDPEDLREIIAAYHRAVTEVVQRHGGYVAQLLGDGVLAYFGWPSAHEDNAEQAVRTGLVVVRAVELLRPSGGPLAARVGIATGLVVVGNVLGEGEVYERGVVGETPNLAARLQAL
jgi:class 3 adenylate cyclase